jgi:hypothetical protein
VASNSKPPGNGDDRPPDGRRPPVQEIIEPDPAEPAYNDATLSPKDFLLAVMRDRRLPLAARIEAATKVSVYEHPRLAQVNQDMTIGATIRIEGGLPLLPGTNIIMPTTETTSSTKKGNGQDPFST